MWTKLLNRYTISIVPILLSREKNKANTVLKIFTYVYIALSIVLFCIMLLLYIPFLPIDILLIYIRNKND